MLSPNYVWRGVSIFFFFFLILNTRYSMGARPPSKYCKKSIHNKEKLESSTEEKGTSDGFRSNLYEQVYHIFITQRKYPLLYRILQFLQHQTEHISTKHYIQWKWALEQLALNSRIGNKIYVFICNFWKKMKATFLILIKYVCNVQEKHSTVPQTLCVFAATRII